MNRRVVRKRRSNPGCFVALIVMIGLGLLAWRGYIVLFRSTAIVQQGAMGNRYTADAIVVRSEQRVDAEGVSEVFYYANEGSVVYKGNKIAEIYAIGYNLSDINKLENIRSQIKQYHQDILLTSYMDPQLDRLDTEIVSRAREVRRIAQGLSEGNLLNLQRQLDTAMTSRQTYLRQKYPNDQRLLAMYNDETSQRKKIEGWTVAYIADKQAIVSFYTDGYENALSAAMVETLMAADVRMVLNGVLPEQSAVQRAKTPVFRKIDQQGFYVLMLSSDREWNPVDGQAYKLQLEGFDDMVFDARVLNSTRAGGEIVVRLYIDADVRPVINARSLRASVGELYMDGLQVPINALWEQHGVRGVVVADGAGVFVPVTVLSSDHRYATVRPVQPGTLLAGQKVKLF